MSVPTDFVSRFCQSAPVQYSKQDVVDDFVKFIQTECSQIGHPEKIITYKMPQHFLNSFTKYEFWNLICNVLIKQMGFQKSPYVFTFGNEYVRMAPKTFHYVKTTTSYQYNEEYTHDDWCSFHEIPDGIVMKFYITQ